MDLRGSLYSSQIEILLVRRGPGMSQNEKKDQKINLKKLLLDIALTIGFLIAMEPKFTGVSLHEWISIALFVGITWHLILNWQWVVRVVRKFLSRMNGRMRLYAVLDTILLLAFLALGISGLAISRVFDTAIRLGLTPETALFWRDVHSVSADVSLLIIGLHIALHWKWIIAMFKCYVFKKRPSKVEACDIPVPEGAAFADGVGK